MQLKDGKKPLGHSLLIPYGGMGEEILYTFWSKPARCLGDRFVAGYHGKSNFLYAFAYSLVQTKRWLGQNIKVATDSPAIQQFWLNELLGDLASFNPILDEIDAGLDHTMWAMPKLFHIAQYYQYEVPFIHIDLDLAFTGPPAFPEDWSVLFYLKETVGAAHRATGPLGEWTIPSLIRLPQMNLGMANYNTGVIGDRTGNLQYVAKMIWEFAFKNNLSGESLNYYLEQWGITCRLKAKGTPVSFVVEGDINDEASHRSANCIHAVGARKRDQAYRDGIKEGLSQLEPDLYAEIKNRIDHENKTK